MCSDRRSLLRTAGGVEACEQGKKPIETLKMFFFLR